jgi:hypothetical protein
VSYIVGVDVGIAYYAVASIRDGVLWRAELVHSTEPLRLGDASARLVIECATVRKEDGHTKKREVDALNRAAGRLGALHPAPEYVLPEKWKAQVSKTLDQKRTLALLSPAEIAILPRLKKELVHVLDAVGIALWACGRKRLSYASSGFVPGPGPSYPLYLGPVTK